MDRDSGELKALRIALKMLGKTDAEASKFIAEKEKKGVKEGAKLVLPGDYDILEKEGMSKDFVKSVAMDIGEGAALSAAMAGGLGLAGLAGKAVGKGVKALRKAAKARKAAKQPPMNRRLGRSTADVKRSIMKKPLRTAGEPLEEGFLFGIKRTGNPDKDRQLLKLSRQAKAEMEGFKNAKPRSRAAIKEKINEIEKSMKRIRDSKTMPDPKAPAKPKGKPMTPSDSSQMKRMEELISKEVELKKAVQTAKGKPRNAKEVMDLNAQLDALQDELAPLKEKFMN
tara:strand:- start:426 stop:1274 length:849 start_codon:yes stop_codon:yes gene_type:complete